MVFAVEQLCVSPLRLGVLNFKQIGVDEVADVVGVKGAPMLINNFLIELEHVISVLHHLVLGLRFTRQVLRRRENPN